MNLSHTSPESHDLLFLEKNGVSGTLVVQSRLSFQRQLFTADRSRNVVNDFCSRQMKSYKLANLITVKVPDTKIYLKTTSRGFLNWYETSSTVLST